MQNTSENHIIPTIPASLLDKEAKYGDASCTRISKTRVADILNRGELKTVIPAEGHRFWGQVGISRAEFISNFTADELTINENIKSVSSLYWDDLIFQNRAISTYIGVNILFSGYYYTPKG